MINEWFLCKIKYKELEAGSDKIKSKSANYLVKAVNYTDAEVYLTTLMEAYYTEVNDATIDNIKSITFDEVIELERLKYNLRSKNPLEIDSKITIHNFYEVCVDHIYIDDNGAEKRSKFKCIVEGEDIVGVCGKTDNAVVDLDEYEIISVKRIKLDEIHVPDASKCVSDDHIVLDLGHLNNKVVVGDTLKLIDTELDDIMVLDVVQRATYIDGYICKIVKYLNSIGDEIELSNQDDMEFNFNTVSFLSHSNEETIVFEIGDDTNQVIRRIEKY